MTRLMGEGGGRNRTTTVPPALTASALEARKTFYCSLCSKGYSRMNEFEAHENSYDHQHKKRFQEMKAMQRKPVDPSRREREERASGVGIVIKPISLAAAEAGEKKAGGFKKGGFKSAFGEEPSAGVAGASGSAGNGAGGAGFKKIGAGAPEVGVKGVVEAEELESDTEDEEGYERYDPARPTD